MATFRILSLVAAILAAVGVGPGAAAVAAADSNTKFPVELGTKLPISSRVSNLHVSYDSQALAAITRRLTITYGPCRSSSPLEAHHTVARVRPSDSAASRLVWILPDDAESGGCLSAWDDAGRLRGRSDGQTLGRRRRKIYGRASIPMTNSTGIDTWGAWFDGVAALKDKQLGPVDVAAAKSKSVAIVGAGMAGLMTYLVLSQAGLNNISILESSHRLGGRVRTEYLSGGPFDYSYQEMGPMRFPATYTNPGSNQTVDISDHQLVFALAEEMNRLNRGNKTLSVDFIPWIQFNQNGLVYRGGFKLPETGLPPTVAQMAANASLNPQAPPLAVDPATQALRASYDAVLSNATLMSEIAQNMFRAHSEYIANSLDGGRAGGGGDTWSEFAYLVNYLGGSLNSTDVIGAAATESFWEKMTLMTYFSPSSTFKTVDGGLDRLPQSFFPLVENVTTFGRKIERVVFHDGPDGEAGGKVELLWRDGFASPRFQSSSHDYAVIAVPFSIVRRWRLPTLSATITNAINNVPYMSGCKVALEFETRFWEKYDENPIYGGCSTTTDIPGIGEICYPSYDINGTGKAALLGSWNAGDWGHRWTGVSEAEHVRYVLDAIVEIHGDSVRDLYTGTYRRLCWDLEEVGGWAHAAVGQHQLYLPEYFKTHKNMIFVGEHTSFTHAWIASALESGIRGAVQLLLELGLVDEAKAAVQKWMARWIDV